MRIAWIGPSPSADGGATYVGTQLLRELADEGVEIDVFLGTRPEEIPEVLQGRPNLEFILNPPNWSWGRWYSKTPLLSFFSGHFARLRAQWTLASKLAERHAQRPYDLVYQFSQSEMGPVRRLRKRLPRLVVHPSTHAAGELAWHKREDALARRCEPTYRRLLVRAMLTGRAFVQRRELPKADRVLGVSRRFSEHLATDYRIPPDRLGFVPNPIDLERFRPEERPVLADPLTLVFVSRISVRKGVELVVDLSHRLADLEGQVRIVILGGPTMWSDYRPLLDDLNPRIAEYHGHRRGPEFLKLYQRAAAVLQPSQYEPFALTVGEALASGTPVVASDEVGAIDGVDSRVCAVFPHGDLDAFEAAVRDVLARVREDKPGLAAIARAEAERLWAPDTITRALIQQLEVALATPRR
jgi:glycosyltransferase involved in cell wall biosynthesis